MKKEISIGYVEGYTDASKTMHAMITNAVKRSNNTMSILDEIISGMFKQIDEIKELTDSVEKQVNESPDICDCCEKQIEGQLSIDDFINKIFDSAENFIIIKGGK